MTTEMRDYKFVRMLHIRADMYDFLYNNYYCKYSTQPTDTQRETRKNVLNCISRIDTEIDVYNCLLDIMTFDNNVDYLAVVDQINRMRTLKRKLSELIH